MNCIIVDDDKFSRKILKDFIDQTDVLTIVAECSSAVEAVNLLTKEKVDLMFLDIKMPGMTGMELIKNLEHKPLIILITGYKEFAIEAFEYNVTDYIVKPLNYARFSKTIERANELHKNQIVGISENNFFP